MRKFSSKIGWRGNVLSTIDHMSITPEKLVKIGPADSEITCLKVGPLKNPEDHKRNIWPAGLACRRGRGRAKSIRTELQVRRQHVRKLAGTLKSAKVPVSMDRRCCTRVKHAGL